MHNNGAALGSLNAVPPKLLTKFDVPEIAYWRGARSSRRIRRRVRAVSRVPALDGAVALSRTSRATASTLRRWQPKLAAGAELRATPRSRRHIAAKNWLAAKQVATDRILLSAREPRRRAAAARVHLSAAAGVPRDPRAEAAAVSALADVGERSRLAADGARALRRGDRRDREALAAAPAARRR